jgi:predicted secreted protein
VLAAFLAIVFVIQNARAFSTTCQGFVDNGKSLTIEPYQFGKQAGLTAFYQVDDSCDSTVPSHTDQCIKGYTDAYNGATK